jgi:hypothetical protein
MLIKVAVGERAKQVHADELTLQNIIYVDEQKIQNLVNLQIGCGGF